MPRQVWKPQQETQANLYKFAWVSFGHLLAFPHVYHTFILTNVFAVQLAMTILPRS